MASRLRFLISSQGLLGLLRAWSRRGTSIFATPRRSQAPAAGGAKGGKGLRRLKRGQSLRSGVAARGDGDGKTAGGDSDGDGGGWSFSECAARRLNADRRERGRSALSAGGRAAHAHAHTRPGGKLVVDAPTCPHTGPAPLRLPRADPAPCLPRARAPSRSRTLQAEHTRARSNLPLPVASVTLGPWHAHACTRARRPPSEPRASPDARTRALGFPEVAARDAALWKRRTAERARHGERGPWETARRVARSLAW